MKRLMFFLAFVLFLGGCEDVFNSDELPQIIIDPVIPMEQTVGSTSLSAKGLTFETKGPWSSSITELATKTSSISSAEWISISPDHGDAAGKYTIDITLEENTTGEDRKAKVVITCGEDEIAFTITQVSTPDVPSDKEPEEDPGLNPLPNVDPADRIVARQVGNTIERFEYNSRGQVSKITEYRSDYLNEGEMREQVTTYSYEGLLVKSNRSVYHYRKVVSDGNYGWLVESVGEGAYVKEEQKTEAIRTEGVLNASGRLTSNKKYRTEYDWVDDKYNEVLSEEITYTYAADGSLAGVIEHNVQEGRSSSYSLSWENGNIQWVEHSVDERYTLTYRKDEYKWPGINLYWDCAYEDFYGEMDIAGLDGKKFKNLHDRVSATNPNTGLTAYCEMVYTFDSKGRVKTMNYRFNGKDDEDDMITFYYGDDVCPQVSTPVYLVKQEPAGVVLRPYAQEGDSFCDATTFTLWKSVRSILSDGSEKAYKYITSGRLVIDVDHGLMIGHDLTREELDQVCNMETPALRISMNTTVADSPAATLATVTVDYPVIGEIPMYVNFYDGFDPQYVELYDTQRAGSRNHGRYVHKYDVFTHSLLTSAIKGHWSVFKRVDGESQDGSRYEIWQFDHELMYNLWRDVYPGMADAVVKAQSKDLYVPVEE